MSGLAPSGDSLHERNALVFFVWNLWFWQKKLRGHYRKGYTI